MVIYVVCLINRLKIKKTIGIILDTVVILQPSIISIITQTMHYSTETDTFQDKERRLFSSLSRFNQHPSSSQETKHLLFWFSGVHPTLSSISAAFQFAFLVNNKSRLRKTGPTIYQTWHPISFSIPYTLLPWREWFPSSPTKIILHFPIRKSSRRLQPLPVIMTSRWRHSSVFPFKSVYKFRFFDRWLVCDFRPQINHKYLD